MFFAVVGVVVFKWRFRESCYELQNDSDSFYIFFSLISTSLLPLLTTLVTTYVWWCFAMNDANEHRLLALARVDDRRLDRYFRWIWKEKRKKSISLESFEGATSTIRKCGWRRRKKKQFSRLYSPLRWPHLVDFNSIIQSCSPVWAGTYQLECFSCISPGG